MQIRLVPAAARDLDHPSPALVHGIMAGFENGETADLLDAVSTLTQTRRPPPWGSYWGLRENPQAVCGICAFKGAPDAVGEVEIAYFTFPRFEGLGVAGAMAQGLVEIAAGQGASAMLAHTLPLRNASGTVLVRLGFEWTGTFDDPEDGEVWRWRLRL
jgi:ribosomal-protein-alanine N-acetyltransferase